MMLFVILLSTFLASSLQTSPSPLAPDIRNVERAEVDVDEAPGVVERTFKISKKGLAYLITGLVLKALLFIKLALAKLTVLGNISILVSKLSLVLSLLLTFGKYFGGISKMLKLKSAGYDGQYYGYYPDAQSHGNYLN